MNRKKQKKKDFTYVWVSIVCLLFFWVPILNVFFFLPASIISGFKAFEKARADPKRYGGAWIAVFAIVLASVSFVYSAAILLLSFLGKISV